jgi:hypothetical protein
MMVSPESSRKKHPEHALDRVRALSREGIVKFTPSVQRDTKNLGYPPDEVYQCLAALQSDDFVESILYEGSAVWNDVYRLTWRRGNGTKDPLYVKLALAANRGSVVLFSFHRPR